MCDSGIEYVGAKLQIETLADGGVFQDGKVPSDQAGPDVGIATNVAVKSAVGWRGEREAAKQGEVDALAPCRSKHRARRERFSAGA